MNNVLEIKINKLKRLKLEIINSGSDRSNPYELTAVGNTLYFEADDGTNGEELWMHKIHTEVTYS